MTSPVAPRQLPSAAEVARTLLQGIGNATVSGPLGHSDVAVSALHGALPNGDLVIAVPTDARSQSVVSAPAGGASGAPDWALAMCVRAEAALPDLTLPRAHLEVLGWASRVPPAERAEALEALALAWPITDLVEHGPGYELLRMEVAEAELHWLGGCTTVDGDDVRDAEPDPVAPHEADLLVQVDALLTPQLLDVVQGLRSLPGPDGGVARLDTTVQARAIGVDRYGLTIQCLTDVGERHVLRLPFAHPLSAGDDAWSTIRTELLTQQTCRDSCHGSSSTSAVTRPSTAPQDAP